MAGDWIKFEIATCDKAEVWGISDQLDIDPDAVVGKLLRVWTWFDQHTEKGNAPIVTKKLLDRLVCVSGFCDSMISVDWMIQESDCISLPNFDHHNGKTAKNRAVTAKRVARHKKSNDQANDEVTTAPLASALPKEEKRREEKSNNKSKPKKDTHAALSEKLGVDVLLIDRIIKHRRDIKQPANTEKKIELVTKDLIACVNQGLFSSVDLAMDHLDGTEWRTLKPDYLKNQSGKQFGINNGRTTAQVVEAFANGDY